MKNEMASYLEALTRKEPMVRAYGLNQLTGLGYTTRIEENKALIAKLFNYIKDDDVEVRRNALRLYERLSWRIGPSNMARYKKILPVIVRIALHDKDNEARRAAIEGIVASGDARVVGVISQLLDTKTGNEFREIVQGHVWEMIVSKGLGPKMRLESVRKYLDNSDPKIRETIDKEIGNRYLG